MLIEITRTTTLSSEQPTPGANLHKGVPTFSVQKFSVGLEDAQKRWPHLKSLATHSNWREEDGKAVCDYNGQRDVYLIEVESLEDAARRWGQIVVQKSEVVGVEFNVEIYDGYRE